MDTAVTALIDKYGVTERTRQFLLAPKKQYINGEFVGAQDNLRVLEPSTGAFLAEVPSASTADVEYAVAARAFMCSVQSTSKLSRRLPSEPSEW
jgi:hypothetical protein